MPAVSYIVQGYYWTVVIKIFVPIYVHKVTSNISDTDYKKRQNDNIGAELDNNFDNTFAKKEALEYPKKRHWFDNIWKK